jgi:hypothetical protein
MAKPKADLVRKDLVIPDLSLLGGPLHWLGCRLNVIHGETNMVRLGIGIGLLAWGVLMLLELLEGFSPKIFSLTVISIPVRFLVAIPLFFLCESSAVPQMAEFAAYIVRSGLVVEASLPTLASDIRRVGRMKDSWLADILLLLAAIGLPLIASTGRLPGRTASWALILRSSADRLTWADYWYLWLCLPFFRFLLFRWLWLLSLWFYFLVRVEKLELRLIPIHSDGAAGLGLPGNSPRDVRSVGFGNLSGLLGGICRKYFLANNDVRFAVLLHSNGSVVERGALHRPPLHI